MQGNNFKVKEEIDQLKFNANIVVALPINIAFSEAKRECSRNSTHLLTFGAIREPRQKRNPGFINKITGKSPHQKHKHCKTGSCDGPTSRLNAKTKK